MTRGLWLGMVGNTLLTRHQAADNPTRASRTLDLSTRMSLLSPRPTSASRHTRSSQSLVELQLPCRDWEATFPKSQAEEAL